MALEFGWFLGPIPTEGWHPVEDALVFCLEAEEISDAILRKRPRILESIRVERDGCIVVKRLLRGDDGEYQPSLITFPQDSLSDLNKFIRGGLVSPRFRRRP